MFVAGVMDVLGSLRPMVGKLASQPIESDEAAELVPLCIEVERVVVAARMMAARVVDSDHWKARGFRSAAAWMAAGGGTTVGPAMAAVGTLGLLDRLAAPTS